MFHPNLSVFVHVVEAELQRVFVALDIARRNLQHDHLVRVGAEQAALGLHAENPAHRKLESRSAQIEVSCVQSSFPF